MGGFIIKRLIIMIVTLWIIVSITFLLMHSVPGGPFSDDEKSLTPAVEKALLEKYNLDDPILKQYFSFLKGLMVLDLGPSYAYEGISVTTLISEGLPTSGRLAAITFISIILTSIPLGILAAVYQDKWPDRLIMIFSTFGITIPLFVKASLLLYVFAFLLNWVPTVGLDSWKGYILPAVSLGLKPIAYLTRLTRTTILEVLQQDYIVTARAKGVRKLAILFKHTLRNALIPVVTYLGTLLAALLTGTFVVEKIFAFPGIGRYFITSITNRDYPTIVGVTIFFSLLLMIMLLVVDVLYVMIDPRIRIDSKGER